MQRYIKAGLLQAVDDVYYLERACEVIVKARSMGAEINMISEKACTSFMDDFVENGMVSSFNRKNI